MILDSDYRIMYMHEGFHGGDEVTIREEIDKQLAGKGH
jgi:hypothetical protein